MIVQATLEHAAALDVKLPGFDVFLNGIGRNRDEYLRSTVEGAHEAWAWLAPDVGCLFGLSYEDFTAPPIFWLYPGPAVREKRLSFLREAVRLKPYFLDKYPVIAGFCNMQFKESERFIRWMGATIGPAKLENGLLMSKFNVSK